MNEPRRTLRRLVLHLAWGACLLLLPFVSAVRAADPIIITSASKQFVVRGLPQRSMLASGAKADVVYVDPSLLAVTCEHVRRALHAELGWGERWRGNVYVNVHPIRSDGDGIDIAARPAGGKWNYYIDMPDEVLRRELVESIVAVLLVEFADRAAKEKSVELPPWLVEGLTAHLVQGPLAGVAMRAHSLQAIADDPELVAPRTVRHADVDQKLREIVQKHGALTFDQLNWPDFDPDDGAAADAYHHSAHLFVRELLKLRGGPDALCATLAMLPEHLNWQTAFLRGFEPHFRRMLDVEKWWSLALIRMKTRDNQLTWSVAEARLQLEEILFTPMQVRLVPGEVPHVTPVALQSVISDWDFVQQTELLQRKLIQLQAARMRLPAEFATLSDGYRATIEKYLRARAGAWFDFTERAAAARAVAELNALDAQRDQLAGKVLTAAR